MMSNTRTLGGWVNRRTASGLLKTTATIGAFAVGAAIVETALVPGLALGAAAVLVPRILPGFGRLRLDKRPPGTFAASRGTLRPHARPDDSNRSPSLSPIPFNRRALKRAVLKTVTFRTIVTIIDFGANYLVIGDIETAAGLSAFSLVVGPFFYLLHETGWTYMGPSGRVVLGRFIISRTLAKTITFRTFASTAEFTTNYIVVRDLGTAAVLSSFGLLLGPFVYFAHERIWDHFSGSEAAEDRAMPDTSIRLLPQAVQA